MGDSEGGQAAAILEVTYFLSMKGGRKWMRGEFSAAPFVPVALQIIHPPPTPRHPPGENDAFNAGVRDANRSVCRDLHLATNRIAGKLSPPNQ